MSWEDEATTRAINAQPWEPLSGMVKKRCSRCRYLFAMSIIEAEITSRWSRLRAGWWER
jgi:hypothetical protein